MHIVSKLIEKENAPVRTLHEEKARIEKEIERYGHAQRDERIVQTLAKIHDINQAISSLQESVTMIWKRTQQIEQELRHIVHDKNILNDQYTAPDNE